MFTLLAIITCVQGTRPITIVAHLATASYDEIAYMHNDWLKGQRTFENQYGVCMVRKLVVQKATKA